MPFATSHTVSLHAPGKETRTSCMRPHTENYSSLLLRHVWLLPAPNARDLMGDLRHSLPRDPSYTVLDPPTGLPVTVPDHSQQLSPRTPSPRLIVSRQTQVGPKPAPPPDRRRQGAAWGLNAGEAWKWPEVALFRRRQRTRLASRRRRWVSPRQVFVLVVSVLTSARLALSGNPTD